MILQLSDAIARLKENEERLDLFINDPVGYQDSSGGTVESLPAFQGRVEHEINQSAGNIAANVAAAEAAEAAAEAARDAALIQAGVYATEADGRAAVSDGQAFQVQGSGDVAAYEYRRVNSGSSTLIATYPSSTAVSRNSLAVASLAGAAENQAATTSPGYIAKATGAYTAAAGWKSSDFVPVLSTSTVRRVGTIIGSSSSACAIAFYDANKAFLGYHNNTLTDQTVKVSDLFPAARYIRSSCASADAFTLTVGISVAASVVEGLAEFEALVGSVVKTEVEDFFATDTLAEGYINLSGAFVAASTWRTTDFIPFNPSALYKMTGYGSPSLVASVSAWDADHAFIGVVDASTTGVFTGKTITVGLADVAYLRASSAEAYTKVFEGTSSQVDQTALTAVWYDLQELKAQSADIVYSEAIDYAAAGLSNGYINLSGEFVAAANWRTTEFISVNPALTYLFTGYGSGTVSSVSLWDENFNFLESALVADVFRQDAALVVTNPAAKYMRASAASTYSFHFNVDGYFVAASSVRELAAALNDIEGLKAAIGAPSAFAPAQAYALQGEPLYLFARGIVADRSVDVAWDISESNPDLCRITPASTTPVPVSLRAFKPDNTTVEVASFNVLVTGTPVNPSVPQNFICLGDSLTDGVSASGIQGAYVNELSRRLTGVGTALLSGAQSPSPFALSNIIFRGTRGDQPVKHEGRGGWRAADYLNNSSSGGVSNAFWNASTGQFDLDFYITNNGFDVGMTPSGALADGSNLTVVVLLGWNDVYSSTPEASAANLGLLIDRIKATRANTRVIAVGLNPAPRANYKAYSGARYVSEREVFELAIRQFGENYRAVCASKAGASFLQLSHVFNPEVAYNSASRAVSLRSTSTLAGVTDHVHPNAIGYAQLADALFYKILYDYCR
jgi:lysophospholipase L1-like esterase